LQQLGPADGQQVRLRLHRSTIARLLELQGRFVAAGQPKPTYGELLDAIVAGVDGDADTVLRLQEAGA
jgi:hypothetical protein